MSYNIGENIRIMRRKCGFTQEDLAKMLCVTPQAVSKWENANAMPDVSQLVPLAQIFGITTDSLLGVVSATYGNAHTEACLNHEKLLMSTSQPDAEKHLAAYTYYRAESEKEPTNYIIMRKCINHGAGVSRYTDFDGFLSDKPKLRDEIFADCERKNLCISRYCEDRNNVEKSDYAMIWIYIHTKEFDKAEKLINRLPSLESNNLKETIMSQLLHFRYGFEKEKEYIFKTIGKLLNATAKEFYFSFEDFAYFADADEAIDFSNKIFSLLDAYKAFDSTRADVLVWENKLRKYTTRCFARKEDFTAAGKELVKIAENFCELSRLGGIFASVEDMKASAVAEIENAVKYVEDNQRKPLTENENYKKAFEIINSYN